MIEFLVVALILALMMLVTVPWWNRIRRRWEFRSAAMEISTTLLAARMRAVKLNANAGVVIIPAAGVNDSHIIDTAGPLPPPTTPGPTPSPAPNQAQLMISGRSFRFVTLPDVQNCGAAYLDLGALGQSTCAIVFDGNGRRIAPPSPTPGEIVIEGPVGGGVMNQITIDTSESGRVRIVTPVNWQ